MRTAALGLLMLGALIGVPSINAAPPGSRESEPSELPRKNCFGELLPYGAIARVGTERIRTCTTSAISPDGNWLAICKDDAPAAEERLRWGEAADHKGHDRVTLWDLRSGRQTTTIEIADCTAIYDLQFRTDSKQLGVVGLRMENGEVLHDHSSINVIDVEKRQIIGSFPEGKLRSSRANIEHFDAEKGMLIQLHERKQTGLGPDDDDDELVGDEEEPKAKRHQEDPLLVWNPRTDKSIRLLDKDEEFFVASEGRVFSLLGKRIRLIDPLSGHVFSEWERPSRAAFPIGISSDGKKLAAIRPIKERVEGGKVARYDQLVVCEIGKQPRVIRKFESRRNIQQISDVSGTILVRVSRSDDEADELLDVLTGRSSTIKSPRHQEFTISPDGRILAFGITDITLIEIASGHEIGTIPNTQGSISSLAFSADSRTLTTVGEDSTAMIWDWATACRLASEQPQSIDRAWAQLDDPDAKIAYVAMRVLEAAPRESIPLLNRELKPDAKLEQQRIQQWIQQLNDDRFSVRERAHRELRNRSRTIQPRLEALLKQRLPTETQNRMKSILGSLEQGQLSLEELRQLRAIQVLEWINTKESRSLLEALAKGESAALPIPEAKATLDRLQMLNFPRDLTLPGSE